MPDQGWKQSCQNGFWMNFNEIKEKMKPFTETYFSWKILSRKKLKFKQRHWLIINLNIEKTNIGLDFCWECSLYSKVFLYILDVWFKSCGISFHTFVNNLSKLLLNSQLSSISWLAFIDGIRFGLHLFSHRRTFRKFILLRFNTSSARYCLEFCISK